MAKGTRKGRKKIILPVTGMTCASCVATIEKGLSKIPGVSRVNVNLASEKASIEYEPSKVDTKTLMDTISDVGYGVAVAKTTFSVSGMTCASCVANIEKALTKVPGVISVNVNLASESRLRLALRTSPIPTLWQRLPAMSFVPSGTR